MDRLRESQLSYEDFRNGVGCCANSRDLDYLGAIILKKVLVSMDSIISESSGLIVEYMSGRKVPEFLVDKYNSFIGARDEVRGLKDRIIKGDFLDEENPEVVLREPYVVREPDWVFKEPFMR